jgi:hypothetical protein
MKPKLRQAWGQTPTRCELFYLVSKGENLRGLEEGIGTLGWFTFELRRNTKFLEFSQVEYEKMYLQLQKC